MNQILRKFCIYKLPFTLSSITAFLFVPLITEAQELDGNFQQLEGYVQPITEFINGTLVPLLFAVAFLIFIYGVIKYFIAGGQDPDAQASGRQLAVYGIIGFILIVALWGIVAIVANLFGINPSDPVINPQPPRAGAPDAGGPPSGCNPADKAAGLC